MGTLTLTLKVSPWSARAYTGFSNLSLSYNWSTCGFRWETLKVRANQLERPNYIVGGS